MKKLRKKDKDKGWKVRESSADAAVTSGIAGV